MKTALVLCGGGSLGSYEVGAWKFLREKGFSFEIVTGTSIGSINGALVCQDNFDDAVALWENIAADKVMVNGMNFYSGFFKDFSWEKSAKLLAFAKTFLKHGGADITPLEALVKSAIDPRRIKLSPTKLGIVTSTYPGFKEVDVLVNELPENRILDFLHASSACFPIFPPYPIEGKKYVDGGYNNNLPIDFALRLGADRVVAVLLHAVPKMPQHPEYMDLPFVTTIRPSRDTGSIMDFEGEVARRNMALGYNDARKSFGEAWGRSFTFEMDERYLATAKRFALDLSSRHLAYFEAIQKSLTYEFIIPKTEKQMFIRTLELMGEWLELPFIEPYKIDDFIALSLQTIRKKSEEKGALNFATTHNFGVALSEKERIPFLIYLAYLYSNHLKTNKVNALIRISPEAGALDALFALFSATHRLV